jgi:hypothetical protein
MMPRAKAILSRGVLLRRDSSTRRVRTADQGAAWSCLLMVLPAYMRAAGPARGMRADYPSAARTSPIQPYAAIAAG